MVDTTSTEKLSVAALISVMLRRQISRTIDVKWLLENEIYARKIISLCREQGLAELNEHADHFEVLMFGKLSIALPELQKIEPINKAEITKRPLSSSTEIEIESEESEEVLDPHRYVGSLR
jgi:hypothetical protein